MFRSAIRLPSNLGRRLSFFPSSSAVRFSTEPRVDPSSPPPPPPPPPQHEQKQQREGPTMAEKVKEENRQKRRFGGFEEEQAHVLRASLQHVGRFGWTELAMISGAKDVGVSPSIVGSIPRKEAALVEFFMDDCLERLLDRIYSGEDLKNLVLSDRLAKLIRVRLEMQAPYISKWPQALSIQAQPMNILTSFKQRAILVDEIWNAAAGDEASDLDWYVKRTVLGGIYSTTEVYMLTDHSPEFRDTWKFLDQRIKDAFDLQKTVQEATYLAEAVSAGMGNSMQGFMKRVFQG